MQTILNWHYSRNDLAGLYMDSFEIGLMPSKVIFAPRKKGKTEFLREDLLPLAEQRGYRVVYSSMWENRSDPAAALNTALIEAAKPRNAGKKFGKMLSRASGSMELSLPIFGNLKASVAIPKSAEQDKALLALPVLIDAVIKASKGKVLLALDEVQHLAKPEFHDFVAALRSCLDARKKEVKSIFTGSSRNRLQMMFSQIKAPLFQFSQTSNFPDLGNEFVDFMSERFHEATGRNLPLKKSREAFARTGYTPGLYRESLLTLMEAGTTDILGAVEFILQQSRINSGYAEQFDMMRALDREVVRAVVDKISLYTEDSLIKFSKRLGVDVTTRQVQGAVERLLADQIIYKEELGIYEIEDSQLSEWLKSTMETDLLTDDQAGV
jgi:hypothetical protein